MVIVFRQLNWDTLFYIIKFDFTLQKFNFIQFVESFIINYAFNINIGSEKQ